jgi:hypothetical protein
MEGDIGMGAALPAVVDERVIEQRHAPEASTFAQRLNELMQQRLSKVNADVASELAGDCKVFLDALERERKELKDPIIEAGRRIDSLFKRLSAPVLDVRDQANQRVFLWDRTERERVAREQREREAQALKEAEERRRAEVDALVNQAAVLGGPTGEALLAEAAATEERPIETVYVEREAPRKASAAVVRTAAYGVVVDVYKFLAWVGNHPNVLGVRVTEDGVGIPQGEINRALKRGLVIDGVKKEEKPIVSNLVKRR